MSNDKAVSVGDLVHYHDTQVKPSIPTNIVRMPDRTTGNLMVCEYSNSTGSSSANAYKAKVNGAYIEPGGNTISGYVELNTLNGEPKIELNRSDDDSSISTKISSRDIYTHQLIVNDETDATIKTRIDKDAIYVDKIGSAYSHTKEAYIDTLHYNSLDPAIETSNQLEDSIFTVDGCPFFFSSNASNEPATKIGAVTYKSGNFGNLLVPAKITKVEIEFTISDDFQNDMGNTFICNCKITDHSELNSFYTVSGSVTTVPERNFSGSDNYGLLAVKPTLNFTYDSNGVYDHTIFTSTMYNDVLMFLRNGAAPLTNIPLKILSITIYQHN